MDAGQSAVVDVFSVILCFAQLTYAHTISDNPSFRPHNLADAVLPHHADPVAH